VLILPFLQGELAQRAAKLEAIATFLKMQLEKRFGVSQRKD